MVRVNIDQVRISSGHQHFYVKDPGVFNEEAASHFWIEVCL